MKEKVSEESNHRDVTESTAAALQLMRIQSQVKVPFTLKTFM